MKELSMEQKAEAYDKAIEGIQEILSSGEDSIKMSRLRLRLQGIFPELKESEGERIRKGIIRNLEYLANRAEGFVKDDLKEKIAWLENQAEQKSIWHNEDEEPKRGSLILLIMQSGTPIVAKIIEPKHTFNHGERWAYIDDLLEKQGEHKPADKIEPKFNFSVGQWIVATGKCVYLITKIDGFNVTLVDVDGNEYVFDTSSLEDAHLWTIQDAKDGDVFATKKGNLFIYDKNRYDNGLAYYYVGLVNKELTIKGPHNMLGHFGELHSVFPATKEQRDTLMKAMADAGYTFDFEKKELKKIKQKPADIIPKDFEKYVEHLLSLSDGEGHGSPAKVKEVSAELFKLAKLEQNPVWSEEDEQITLSIEQVMNCASLLNIVPEKTDKIRTWLKSLKQRIGK